MARLLKQSTILQHSQLIAYVSIKFGGLGILYPSHKSAPYFVIAMTNAMRFAKRWARHSKDLEPTRFYNTIASLCPQESNSKSRILRRFYTLLPQVGEVAPPPSKPDDERTHNFLHRTSASRTSSYIKDLCGRQIQAELYGHVHNEYLEHLKHLPSIVSPHMSTPLVAMSRSIPAHMLLNWNSEYALLRKRMMPLYNPTNCPHCWCTQTHDCWGDHVTSCTTNNKKVASNFIRDGWALALKKVFADAGYIRPNAKLKKEKPIIVKCDPLANPVDLFLR